jgi:hypothetical protein
VIGLKKAAFAAFFHERLILFTQGKMRDDALVAAANGLSCHIFRNQGAKESKSGIVVSM